MTGHDRFERVVDRLDGAWAVYVPTPRHEDPRGSVERAQLSRFDAPDESTAHQWARHVTGDWRAFAVRQDWQLRDGIRENNDMDATRCTCRVCGREFEPSYGERARCRDCLATQHQAAERALGVE